MNLSAQKRLLALACAVATLPFTPSLSAAQVNAAAVADGIRGLKDGPLRQSLKTKPE